MKDQIISIKKPLQNIEVKVDSSGAKEVATKPIIELPEPDVSYLNVFFFLWAASLFPYQCYRVLPSIFQYVVTLLSARSITLSYIGLV